MARFIFPLQNILNMKEKLEEQAKNEYSQANMRLHEAEDEEERLRQREADAEEDLKNILAESLDVMEIKKKEDAVERKTFEKLREHAFEDFVKEQNLAEQKEVDELVSYRHGRV